MNLALLLRVCLYRVMDMPVLVLYNAGIRFFC